MPFITRRRREKKRTEGGVGGERRGKRVDCRVARENEILREEEVRVGDHKLDDSDLLCDLLHRLFVQRLARAAAQTQADRRAAHCAARPRQLGRPGTVLVARWMRRDVRPYSI